MYRHLRQQCRSLKCVSRIEGGGEVGGETAAPGHTAHSTYAHSTQHLDTQHTAPKHTAYSTWTHSTVHLRTKHTAPGHTAHST